MTLLTVLSLAYIIYLSLMVEFIEKGTKRFEIANEVLQDIQPLINIISGVALIIAVARAQI